MAGQPPRMLEDTARYGLLRAIVAELADAGQLQVFGGIAHTPGFLRILADFIYELKQNLVYEDHFDAAIRSDKDRELALIYRRYQERLRQSDLVDREGEGWLALDVLRQAKFDDIGGDVRLLIVDGYDQFTPLQASLLMLVANRAQEALITLSTVPGREETVGRRFSRGALAAPEVQPWPGGHQRSRTPTGPASAAASHDRPVIPAGASATARR